jgi:hypothetical protein
MNRRLIKAAKAEEEVFAQTPSKSAIEQSWKVGGGRVCSVAELIGDWAKLDGRRRSRRRSLFNRRINRRFSKVIRSEQKQEQEEPKVYAQSPMNSAIEQNCKVGGGYLCSIVDQFGD